MHQNIPKNFCAIWRLSSSGTLASNLMYASTLRSAVMAPFLIYIQISQKNGCANERLTLSGTLTTNLKNSLKWTHLVINIKPKGFWGYMKELTINERIRDREVRLIGADGTQYGVIAIAEARQIAEEQGLDLCKVSPDGAVPATCKLMDYGKYRYEQQKREKEAKKNQKVIEIKEIRLSATIDVGDTTRLAAQTAKFLQEGNKVKASIRLKGRQQTHPELAVDIINDYIEMVGDCTVEKKPTQEGRNIFTILAPAKIK